MECHVQPYKACTWRCTAYKACTWRCTSLQVLYVSLYSPTRPARGAAQPYKSCTCRCTALQVLYVSLHSPTRPARGAAQPYKSCTCRCTALQGLRCTALLSHPTYSRVSAASVASLAKLTAPCPLLSGYCVMLRAKLHRIV